MPSSSKKQHNFMAAVDNSPAFAKKAGVPKSVGQDFMSADKSIKFGPAKPSRASLQKVNKPDTRQGKSELFAKGGITMATKMNPGFAAMMAKKKATFEKSGKDIEKKGMKEGSKADMALDEKQAGMKKGGCTKMAKGGLTVTKAVKMPKFANANTTLSDLKGKLTKPSGGEGAEKSYKANTKIVKHRQGDGIASRGLTKIGRSKEI
jgi:hypothetical protein